MCTLEKKGNIYILTLTGSGQHRLNPTLIDSIRSALLILRSDQSSSSPYTALITTSQGKFFSNGFDLDWAKSSPSRLKLMSSKLQSLISDLISLPMPTIAAITGHATAAGMILALSHDYVLMRKDRGFLYMSEMDIGLVIPKWFVVLLKCKIGESKARREVILGAAKLTAEMGLERGIVESVYGSAEETVEAAVKLGEEMVGRRWVGDVYAKNRMEVLREVMESIGLVEDVSEEDIDRFKKIQSNL
ncbi:enoyl-CoA delta isomerase 1, peroxisomal-like [Euphorbia lathyris]|uniref:enoyl-CoA delta isomerase 1, peroxisomal-like n=1 Tax=Euphorbia lathyris TaxID=212925 RepID=UPI00331338FD